MTQPTQTYKAFSFDHDEVDEEYPPAVMSREVVLTRYDRRYQAVRAATDKRDAMLAIPNPTDTERLRLTVCERDLVKAQAAFSKEMARGMTDEGRKQDRLDLYRKTPEGREVYNTSRRKKRFTANADLSAMTPEDKAAHKREQHAIVARAYRRRQKEALARQTAADVVQSAPDVVQATEQASVPAFDLEAAEPRLAAIGNEIAATEAVVKYWADFAKKVGLADPADLQGDILVQYQAAAAKLPKLNSEYEAVGIHIIQNSPAARAERSVLLQ